MTRRINAGSLTLLLVVSAATGQVTAQKAAPLPLIPSGCQRTVPAPTAEPPAGSSPVVLMFELCAADDDRPVLAPIEEYVSRIRVMSSVSQPSRGRWIPFTRDVERTVDADLELLRAQGFVAAVKAEVKDYRFPNGVIGKVITYHVTERSAGR